MLINYVAGKPNRRATIPTFLPASLQLRLIILATHVSVLLRVRAL